MARCVEASMHTFSVLPPASASCLGVPYLLLIRDELGLEGNTFTLQYQSWDSPENEAFKTSGIIFSCTLALHWVRWVLAADTMTICGPSGILGGLSQSCLRLSIWRVSLSTYYVPILCFLCVLVCICIHMWTGVRGQHWASSLLLCLIFETGSQVWLSWLARELQGPSVSASSVLDYSLILLFHMGAGVLNLGPQACAASPILTEPSLSLITWL